MKQIEVKVLRFMPNAMSDDFGDGGVSVYDGTELEVLSGGAEPGRTLWIYHESEVPEDSIWRAAGRRLRLSLPAEVLEPGVQIFSGAVTNIQAL